MLFFCPTNRQPTEPRMMMDDCSKNHLPWIFLWSSLVYRVVKGGPRGGVPLIFPKVPQSSLGILFRRFIPANSFQPALSFGRSLCTSLQWLWQNWQRMRSTLGERREVFFAQRQPSFYTQLTLLNLFFLNTWLASHPLLVLDVPCLTARFLAGYWHQGEIVSYHSQLIGSQQINVSHGGLVYDKHVFFHLFQGF